MVKVRYLEKIGIIEKGEIVDVSEEEAKIYVDEEHICELVEKPIIIPEKIGDTNFVLIGGDGKQPIEKGWQKKIHRIDDPILQQHIKQGKNYGVQSNNSFMIIDGKSYFLIVVDFDKKDFQDKVISKFPETFTTTSGSQKNCFHLWFASDNNKPFKIKDEKLESLSDVIGEGNQIIAPGSKHSSGSTYSVVKDIPITFLSYSEIEAILKPHDRTPKKIEKNPKQYSPKGIGNDVTERMINAIPMEYVLNEMGVDISKNPTNCPFHSSAGGKCLGWNDVTAHCFHCDNSWNKFSFIREWKKLTNKETFDWFAEKSGMTEELKKSRKEFINEKEIVEIKTEKTYSPQIVKDKYLDLIKDKNWGSASELLRNYVLERLRIYTIKDDQKTEMWVYKNGIYLPQGKSEIKEILRNLLGKWYSNWIFGKVVEKIEPDTYIQADKFFQINYKDEIPVLNGILNVKTLELNPYNPDKIFFSKIPIFFDLKAQCPKIEEFLKQTLKDEEDINVFFELAGFGLYKEYSIEKAIMLVGNGRNGKGKCIELLKRFVGPENCCSIPLISLRCDGFSVSELFSKLFNLAGDIGNQDLKDTSMFKSLTGRDLVNGKRKFQNDIIFENYSKFVFACNELPMVYDLSKGFWDRWVLLEFPYTFVTQEEIDKTIDKTNLKLRNPNIISEIATETEMSGFLNQALIGLQRLKENKDFSSTKGSEEVKSTWIKKSNSFIAFCYDYIGDDYEGKIVKKELRKRYSAYCKENKITPKSDFVIKRVLQDTFGVTEDRTSVGFTNIVEYCWEGIKWKKM